MPAGRLEVTVTDGLMPQFSMYTTPYYLFDGMKFFMAKLRKKLDMRFGKMLGWNLTLEHFIFLCGATAGIALSAFGAISNFIMGLHAIAVLIPFINLVVDISCVVYSIKTQRWRGAAVLIFLFASFVLFPFLWFTTGGTMSSSLPLIIGLGVVLAIVFDGKLRIFFFFFTLLLYSAFIVIEMYHPNNFVPYPSREAWYMDVLFGFVLSFLASGGLAFFTLHRYNVAKNETEALLQQLETISITDPLTGVFNRRHLMACLDEEMRRAFDNGTPLALCIVDIDHFKHVNDVYGHLCGDEVLKKIAETILRCLGESEIFGRYGGEEFIILFSDFNLSAALQTIQKFNEALQHADWSHGEPITVSCGIGVYKKGLSYSKFLENADANLYEAKKNGRNRVKY